MKPNSVFKSEEGKAKIRAYYHAILGTFPLTHRSVDTSYGNTFVLEVGKAENPPLALLHGSCSNSAAWLGDMAPLAEHYHLFAIDIVGEPGNSEDIRPSIEPKAFTAWLEEVLTGLGIGKVSLVGNSFGGWIALQYAARFPQRVTSLALLAPSGMCEPKETFMQQTTDIASNAETAADTTKAVLGDASIPNEVLEFMNLVMENFIPMTGALSVLSIGQLQRLTMPVLYIAGTHDVTMDTEKASQRLRELVPQAEIHLVQGAHVITAASHMILPFLAKETQQCKS